MPVTLPPVGHRERKKQATRQAIHDAAFDLVYRQGFSATTIEAISERAGVAPRTFWAYFGSKEDAVIGRESDSLITLADAVRARPSTEDAFTALRTVLADFLVDRVVDVKREVRRQKLIRREPELSAAFAALYEEWERILVSAIAARLGVDSAKDMTPGVIVVATCGMCRVAQHRWADDGGREPLTEVLDLAFEQLGRALSPLLPDALARTAE
jgi:AcrR family transcriptional regulator